MITVLLTIIVVLLLVLAVSLFFAWKKISIYLTWNTRYSSTEYERAVTTRKTKPSDAQPSITEQKGRAVKPVDDLVDLADLDFETGTKAIEELVNGG